VHIKELYLEIAGIVNIVLFIYRPKPIPLNIRSYDHIAERSHLGAEPDSLRIHFDLGVFLLMLRSSGRVVNQ